jgi:hypothetical protein
MKTLCQDCLRVVEVSLADYRAADYGKGLCACGGKVCHCDACLLSIAKMSCHDWSTPYLGQMRPVFAWTPEKGMVTDGACE